MTAPGAMSERDWQQRVLDLAALRGWRTFHPHDSRRSTAGWPDLALVRRGRLVLAELKAQHGRVSADQQAWLTDLAACPAAEVHVWRPADWPSVQQVLR